MGVVECRSVSVSHGSVRALAGVDLTVEEGETLALLGPSGSGKTTLLHAVAGFVELVDGSIEINGESASTPRSVLPPERRPIGMVFQNYALWPHLSAVETVGYPLRRAGLGKREARRRALELLDLVGVGDLGHRKPAELSGGQQQRVGLARALARDALVYLFDEPTAHLDASVRVAVSEEIGRRRAETGAGAIYATHDAFEALAIADRVAILREGRLVQVAAPSVIYERPVDMWAASLTGPAAALVVELDPQSGMKVTFDGQAVAVRTSIDGDFAGHTTMVVRPEWVEMGGGTRGEVREVWYRGPHTDYRIETEHGILYARVTGPPSMRVGERGGWTVRRGWIPRPGVVGHRR